MPKIIFKCGYKVVGVLNVRYTFMMKFSKSNITKYLQRKYYQQKYKMFIIMSVLCNHTIET